MNNETFRKQLPKITNKKHLAFIEEYLISKNATKAAIKSGYKVKSARNHGYRLLKNDDIRLHIQFLLREEHKKLDLRANDILRELKAIAFSRVTDFIEDNSVDEISRLDLDNFKSLAEYRKAVRKLSTGYRIKKIEDIGDSAAALDSIEISKDGVIKINLKGKLAALKLIGQHLGMWKFEPKTVERDRESNLERIRLSLSKIRRRRRGAEVQR